MKLVIQIPCYEEEDALPETLADLPRKMEGFERVEWLVVDDGSRDGTARVAREGGVDHVVRLPEHRGLAAAFAAGLEASLRVGADVVVNTDADNQYDARDIELLVGPILEGRADVVVGERPLSAADGHGWLKRRVSRLGSWVVRLASGTEVRDAPSGFRAMSRAAALRLRVTSRYTYTLETLIQAACSGLRVTGVPVRVHPPRRPSRLVRSTAVYVAEGARAIVRALVRYRPLRAFGAAGAMAALVAVAAWAWFAARPASLVAMASAVTSTVAAVACVLVGLVGELFAAKRRSLERPEERLGERDPPGREEGRRQ